MCLLAFSWQENTEYPFVFIGNRDEFYNRPTRPAHFWSDYNHVLAGRDLKAGGTWLGITTDGRFAALTNYRNPGEKQKNDAPSRGDLCADFLKGSLSPKHYIDEVAQRAHQYNGFNLLAGDRHSLYFLSGQEAVAQKLSPGLYGLSNATLNTPWFKVTRAKDGLKAVLNGPITTQRLLEAFYDNTKAPKDSVQHTGLPRPIEKMLSPMFIESPAYGTCSSAAIVVDGAGRVKFHERQYKKGKPGADEEFTFELDS